MNRISFSRRLLEGKAECLRKAEDGFTLVELLAVLTIIAILAAAFVPVMSGFIEDAEKKAYVSEAYLVRTAVQSYIIEQNAKGTLSDMELFMNIVMPELDSPENALGEILKGSYTAGAKIKGTGYNSKTCKVVGFIYQVDKYEIEIKYDSDVEVRDRN